MWETPFRDAGRVVDVFFRASRFGVSGFGFIIARPMNDTILSRRRNMRPFLARLASVVGVLLVLCGSVSASDKDNCLLCHRFRGLSRLDPKTNELRLFFCSAEYYEYRQGPHARVDCTGCHDPDEVRVIPHHVKTRVDCTKTCHVSQATGVALRFSHRRVEASLERSIHSPETLDALKFEPPLLRPGQSACLYCHDQPTFGFDRGVPEGFLRHSGGTRCDTCHSEEVPIDITYFANHVASRMKPARPVKQLAQVCAVCHSDPQIMKRTGGHDPVASYLQSFHGKASLLGSHKTATCVECHSAPDGDQHMMLAKDDPGSSINPVNLPDTCRTTACHPGAPPEMSRAAVHLDLDPTQRTPEFYVAIFFIVMTASVMAIFFLLVVLELFNALVRPHDHEHERLVRLARRVLQHPEGRQLVQRMSIHERLQHWGMAIPFAVLVFTGMPIKFAETHWAQTIVTFMGGLAVFRTMHRVAGVLLIAVFFYHIGYLLVKLAMQLHRDRKAGARKSLWRYIYDAPQMLRPQDAIDFLQLMGYLLFLRKERPRFRRFNFAEKFEYWAVFWGMPVMGLSGLALWGNAAISEQFTGRILNFAFIIHSDEAYLAFIYIATIHLFSVMFSPAVFPLSPGSLSGQAPAEELVEGHRGELEAIAARLGIDADDEHAGAGRSLRDRVCSAVRRVFCRAYAGVAMAAYIFVAYTSLHFLATILESHSKAPVEIVGIPKRLDADEFLKAAAAPSPAEAADPGHRARGPLAHFHQIPKWFQPDPKNTCTTAGCHAPLPHGKDVSVRAFLNMHTTFTDCTVCHVAGEKTEAQARWIALPGRDLMDTPPILKLAQLLEKTHEIKTEDAPALSKRLIGLVRAALPASGNHWQLQDWLLRLRITNPRSKVFRRIVREMGASIHMHVHGEYGAKIALFDHGAMVGTPTDKQKEAIRQFLALGPSASEAQRKPLLDVVHEHVRPTGAMCTPCHQANPTLVDVRKLGYPQARLQRLQHNTIMESVLSIEQGKPFYLPVQPGTQRP